MLVTRPRDVARHLNAPLLVERESYLQYLASQGRSRNSQRDAGGYLLQVVGHLKLTRLRTFRTDELRLAAQSWSRRNGHFNPKTNYGRIAFMHYARGWFRFHGKLIEPHKWNEPQDERVQLYKQYLCTELGFAPRTIDSRVWCLNRFLTWLAEVDMELPEVTVAHVERYLDYVEARGWKPRTVACVAEHLKVFFRFAERKRWGCRGVSGGVFGPRNPTIVRTPSIERGPQWKDVRRLIECANGENDNDYRARAVLTLLSSYALRTSEICHLLVSDIDFRERIITIRRSKSQLTQRFSLNSEVLTSIKKYIDKGRPKSAHRNLFLTLREPYGPIQQASVYNITRTRMNRLGVVSVNRGAHALRHACANRLLRMGTPVPRVASLLGHVSSRYVGTYIQHSIEDLRSVSNFPLSDIWTSK